jgi:arginyl-tRNA synthetase
MNYFGDWGKHVGLLGAGWQKYGSEDLLKEDPISHILQVYNKISEDFKPELEASKLAKDDHQNTAEIEGRGIFAERDTFFKRIEDGDEDATALWKRLSDPTIENLKASYHRLGIKFDEYSGESHVKPETMVEVESLLKSKGISEESDGSWVVHFEKHGGKGLGTQVLRGRTGSSTYLLRDIAAVLDREAAHGFDKMIYVVSSRQSSHFSRVILAVELLGRADIAAKLQHIGFGDIQGMNAELKTARTLGEILDEFATLLQEALPADVVGNGDEKTKDMNAISALIAQDMSGRRTHGYTFDFKRMLSLENDSGLKLQHWRGVLSRTVAELGTEEVAAAALDYSHLRNDDSEELLRVMLLYPETIATTFKSTEPHGILAYLLRLVNALSYCLTEGEEEEDEDDGAGPSEPVQDKNSVEYRRAQLAMYQEAKSILENGMGLLGFPITTTGVS